MRKFLICFLFLIIPLISESTNKKITVEVTLVRLPKNILPEDILPKPPFGMINNVDESAKKLLNFIETNEQKDISIKKFKVTTYNEKEVIYNGMKDGVYMFKTGDETYILKELKGKDGIGIYFYAFPKLEDGKIIIEYELLERRISEIKKMSSPEGEFNLPIFSSSESNSIIPLENNKPFIVSTISSIKNEGNEICTFIIMNAIVEEE